MVKQKQRASAVKGANKKSARGDRASNSNHEVTLGGEGKEEEEEEEEEEGWVMVKKQRITILIPPLPGAGKSTISKPGPGQLQASHRETTENQSMVPLQEIHSLPSVDDHENSTPLAIDKILEIDKEPLVGHATTLAASQGMDARVKMGRPDHIESKKMDVTIKRGNPNYTGSENMDAAAKTAKQYHVGSERMDFTIRPGKPNYAGTFRPRGVHGLSKTERSTKRPCLMHGPGALNTRNSLLNRKMRLSYLEKKLQQSGGLSGWLLSLGLGQFVRIFQARSINKHQLLNLTMKNLKDMGANAVGPRRKLLHAIDCVCQPFSFQAL